MGNVASGDLSFSFPSPLFFFSLSKLHRSTANREPLIRFSARIQVDNFTNRKPPRAAFSNENETVAKELDCYASAESVLMGALWKVRRNFMGAAVGDRLRKTVGRQAGGSACARASYKINLRPGLHTYVIEPNLSRADSESVEFDSRFESIMRYRNIRSLEHK